MKQKTEHQKGTVENIYQLNGTVPIVKAIPFGLQHILAMFVANIAPILIVASACGLSDQNTAMLIQSAMLIAGFFIRLVQACRLSWVLALHSFPFSALSGHNTAMVQLWGRFSSAVLSRAF